MASLLNKLTHHAIFVITHKVTSLASALTLAGFALWDVIDQTFLDGLSPVGVEHGVVIHGLVIVLKSLAEFFENTSEAVKTHREGRHPLGKAEHQE